MMKNFEDVNAAGKELMDNSLKSIAAVSKSAQVIASESADYAKQSLEMSTGFFEKLVAAKTLDKAIEIQSDFAKSAYEGYVAQATKLGEIYADMAKEAYKPFEAALSKAK